MTKIQNWVKSNLHVILPAVGTLFALAVQQGWLNANSKLVTVVLGLLSTFGIHLVAKK